MSKDILFNNQMTKFTPSLRLCDTYVTVDNNRPITVPDDLVRPITIDGFAYNVADRPDEAAFFRAPTGYGPIQIDGKELWHGRWGQLTVGNHVVVIQHNPRRTPPAP